MAVAKDPVKAMKVAATELPDVVEGTSCNQSSFKVGKQAFLYVGPGARGIGYKAMFKLDDSISAAQELADTSPESFEVGKGNWVTARFSQDSPLPKKIWGRWLKESYRLATVGKSASK